MLLLRTAAVTSSARSGGGHAQSHAGRHAAVCRRPLHRRRQLTSVQCLQQQQQQEETAAVDSVQVCLFAQRVESRCFEEGSAKAPAVDVPAKAPRLQFSQACLLAQPDSCSHHADAADPTSWACTLRHQVLLDDAQFQRGLHESIEAPPPLPLHNVFDRSTEAPDRGFAAQNGVSVEETALESNGEVAAEGDGSQQQQQPPQRRLPLFDAKVSVESGCNCVVDEQLKPVVWRANAQERSPGLAPISAGCSHVNAPHVTLLNWALQHQPPPVPADELDEQTRAADQSQCCCPSVGRFPLRAEGRQTPCAELSIHGTRRRRRP